MDRGAEIEGRIDVEGSRLALRRAEACPLTSGGRVAVDQASVDIDHSRALVERYELDARHARVFGQA